MPVCAILIACVLVYLLCKYLSEEKPEKRQNSVYGNVAVNVPLASNPYGPHAQANPTSWPNDEGKYSLFPGNPQAQQGAKLEIDNLMPASWRGIKNCATETTDDAEWAKYAPSKAAFDRYITASGSVRLGVNTRDSNSKTLGVPLLLRPSPPVPLSTQEMPFLDSDQRQSLIYNATGHFPQDTSC